MILEFFFNLYVYFSLKLDYLDCLENDDWLNKWYLLI